MLHLTCHAVNISQEIQAYAEVRPKPHDDYMLYHQWCTVD
jgi:hypothetical protein